jgi:MFS family permease
MGFGMGLLSTSSIVLIQEIVPWTERGSATASNIFARNFGSALGATALGAVLNYGLTRFGTADGVSAEQLKQLLDQPGTTTAVSSPVRLVLHQSLHVTFWAIFALSVAIVVVARLVPPISLGRNREEIAR